MTVTGWRCLIRIIFHGEKRRDEVDSLIWKVHILIEMTQSHAFDRPLHYIGRDRMARSGLVTSIARSLVEKRDGRWVALQNVVGVTGEWGTGKSTLLNFVASYLDAFDGIVVVRFEPWLVSSEADVIDAFLREISRKVGASPGERVRGLAAEIDKYREAVAGAAEYAFPGAGTLAKFIPRMRTRTLTDRKIRLARRLLDFQGSIVVVVDELDRVDNTDVKEVAKFINSVGSLPGISFLVGYDYKRVSKILSASDDTQSGEEYLRKIVQVNIPLRGMSATTCLPSD